MQEDQNQREKIEGWKEKNRGWGELKMLQFWLLKMEEGSRNTGSLWKLEKAWRPILYSLQKQTALLTNVFWPSEIHFRVLTSQTVRK